MTQQAETRRVAGWLNDLAVLTAGSAPLADAKARAATMAGVLADDYPTAAFCRPSLTHVASKCRFFPSYAELCEHLGGWWQGHRPEPSTVYTPDAWSQRVAAEHSEAIEDWTDPGKVRAAIRALIDHPMRGVLGHMLAGLVGRHAPQHLGLFPPEWIEASPDQPQRLNDRAPRPRHLTPEQIDAEKTRLSQPRSAA